MEIEDFVTVFEVTEGEAPLWQFFVGPQPVTTKTPAIADAMMLAIKTSGKVRVVFDEQSHDIRQVRIAYSYVCEAKRIELCGNDQPVRICMAKRFTRCEPEPPRG